MKIYRTLLERLRSSFLRDAASLAAGTAIAQIVQISSLFLIARLYSASDFGLFAVFSGAVWIGAVLSTLQFEHLLLQPKSEYATARLRKISLYIVIFNSLTISLAGGVFWLCGTRESPWPLLGPTVAAIGISQIYRYWCIKQKAFAAVSKAIVLGAIVQSTALAAPLVGIPANTITLTIAQLLGSGTTALILLCAAPPTPPVTLNYIDTIRYGRLWMGKALCLTVAHGMKTAGGRLPVFAISLSATNTGDHEIAGYYAMVERAITGPQSLISNAVSDVFRQRATVLYTAGISFRPLVVKIVILMACLAMPAFILAFVAAPWLFATAFGEPWREAGTIARVVLVGEFAAFVLLSVNSTAIVVRNEWFVLLWHGTMLGARLLVLASTWFWELHAMTTLMLLASILIIFHVLDGVAAWKFSKP